ncbi:MAG TPA: aldose 1-epimerase family protein, partial [Acidimicrobiales bacterium]|nr:aldose 1-epimerase family protein [Acidimicrobiales bacterium]
EDEMIAHPSGAQYEISHGDQRATIVEVGGGVRAYSWGDRDVLDPYPLTEMCDGAHGTPLVPWPNRLGDGRYCFDGTEYQVALTEPEHHNAIHGFLRWVPWQPRERSGDSVVMGTRLYPRSGYPFTVDVQIAYTLDDDGLTVAATATNIGDRPCPFGIGQHPYLSAGGGVVDDCLLCIDAAARLMTDSRALPTATVPVEGTPYDFREPRRLGSMELDTAFADLGRDATGRAYVTLTSPDDRSAVLWADEGYTLLELFTGDTLRPERRRRGLGSEPMSCPPNAFQTGAGLARLGPGVSATASWGARLV